MKVLLTGTFGNLGRMVVRELRSRGIDVRCTDLPNARNRRAAKQLEGHVEITWGDIRDAEWLACQVEGVDAVIHLAGLLPPATENQPELAEAVNVTAAQQLVEAVARSPRKPLLLYPSSLTVFGMTRDQAPPRRASDPVRATDACTRHKLAVERQLAESPHRRLRGFAHARGRSGDAPEAGRGARRQPARVRPPRGRRPGDGERRPAEGRGGSQNPVDRRRPALPGHPVHVPRRRARSSGAALVRLHGHDAYYTDWLDTEESQRLLDYQRHGFEDYGDEMAQRLRWARRLLWPLRPLLNPLLAAFVGRLKRRASVAAR